MKVAAVLILFKARPIKSIMTKSVSWIAVDALLTYYGVYLWILSNAAPYGFMYPTYKSMIQKCIGKGIKVPEVQGFDLNEISENKCKFYTYDPIF